MAMLRPSNFAVEQTAGSHTLASGCSPRRSAAWLCACGTQVRTGLSSW